jgi:hypothetical protein
MIGQNCNRANLKKFLDISFQIILHLQSSSCAQRLCTTLLLTKLHFNRVSVQMFAHSSLTLQNLARDENLVLRSKTRNIIFKKTNIQVRAAMRPY